MIELRPEEQRLLETAPLLNWRRTARGNRSLTLYGITAVVSHHGRSPDPYGVSICVDGKWGHCWDQHGRPAYHRTFGMAAHHAVRAILAAERLRPRPTT